MRRRQVFSQPKPKTVEPSLEDQYAEKFGKRPHWKMKRETMLKRLTDGVE